MNNQYHVVYFKFFFSFRGLGPLVFSESNLIRNYQSYYFRHLVGLLGWEISPSQDICKGQQNNETRTYTHARAGFEPAIPVFKRYKTVWQHSLRYTHPVTTLQSQSRVSAEALDIKMSEHSSQPSPPYFHFTIHDHYFT